MAITPVPSLSALGWVRSPAEKADALLSHFYTSLYSQTALYPDQVSSLPYVIERYGRDPTEVTLQLRRTLEKYLGAYYEVVSVDVTHNDGPNNVTGKITLRLNVVITEEGNQYSLGALITTIDAKITEIIRYNNG